MDKIFALLHSQYETENILNATKLVRSLTTAELTDKKVIVKALNY